MSPQLLSRINACVLGYVINIYLLLECSLSSGKYALVALCAAWATDFALGHLGAFRFARRFAECTAVVSIVSTAIGVYFALT